MCFIGLIVLDKFIVLLLWVDDVVVFWVNCWIEIVIEDGDELVVVLNFVYVCCLRGFILSSVVLSFIVDVVEWVVVVDCYFVELC